MSFSPRIVTLTLNPALDKNTSVESIVPDKKLRCQQPETAPGGGGVNVSRALHTLGVPSLAVYLAGGFTGSYFTQLLLQEGVETLPLPVKNELRENLIVVDRSSRQQYRFGMEGAAVTEPEWQQCLDALEKENFDILAASGSLPPGIPDNFYRLLAELVKRKNAKLVIDTSGAALKEALEEGVYLIKPNLNELSSIYGKEELSRADAENACREIIARGLCEVIVVSMGADGALLAKGNEVYFSDAPKAEKKSTVGAGDSMVAGMLAGIAKNYDWQTILRSGVAAGTAATMSEGTRLCQLKDYEMLFAGLNQAGTGPA
ncbi:MAG: 1-phosphofructokinase family hexose kinase [Bacteroidota bacterium]